MNSAQVIMSVIALIMVFVTGAWAYRKDKVSRKEDKEQESY